MPIDQNSFIDLRTIIGEPVGDGIPIMIDCPWHGDERRSNLAVFHDHGHCFAGCERGRFVRRYEMAALLMGLWDGRAETVLAAVSAVKKRLATTPFVPYTAPVRVCKPRVLDAHSPAAFMRFLVETPETLAYFQKWRGYSSETIRRFQLGWTGSHFSVPVRGVAGDLRSIRYRADPRCVAPGDGDKYEGIAGSNEAQLFSLPLLHGVTEIRDLWITEGEYDQIAVCQLARSSPGTYSVTFTNGAARLSRFLEAWASVGISVRRYIAATDQDEQGEQAASELATQLPTCVRARWERGKDMSEYLVAGGDLASVRLLDKRA